MAEEKNGEKSVTEFDSGDLKGLRVYKDGGESPANGRILRFAGYAAGLDRAPGRMVVLYDESPGNVRDISTWITVARDEFEEYFVVRDEDQR
jgi:hypothetical protein